MRSADDRFEYLGADGEPLPPGSALGDAHRFAFRCRRPAARRFCSLNVRGRGHDVPQRSWALTGTVDAPTLTPSVNCENCWHGYIKGGVFMKTNNRAEEAQ